MGESMWTPDYHMHMWASGQTAATMLKAYDRVEWSGMH